MMTLTAKRRQAAIAIAGLTAVALAGLLIPQTDSAGQALDWVRAQGPWAPLILIAAYVVAAVALLPTWLLSIGAGYLFGLTGGVLSASIGSTLGATCAFVVARRWFGRRAAAAVAKQCNLAALDRGIARNGFRLVLLARLSPVLPANVLNYAVPLTGIRQRDFVLASWLGMFPITFAYVYLGSTLADLAALETSNWPPSTWHLALGLLGLLATTALLGLLAHLARQTPGTDHENAVMAGANPASRKAREEAPVRA